MLLAASKLYQSLNQYEGINVVNLLEGEYDWQRKPNAIFVGNPFNYDAHPLVSGDSFLLGYNGKAVIIIYNDNGYYQILAAGTTDEGTRDVVNKLADWEISEISELKWGQYITDDEDSQLSPEQIKEQMAQESLERAEISQRLASEYREYEESVLLPACGGEYYNSFIETMSQGMSFKTVKPPGFKTVKEVTATDVSEDEITLRVRDFQTGGTESKTMRIGNLEKAEINGLNVVVGKKIDDVNKGGIMLCVSETKETQEKADCTGCFIDNKCFPIGTRTGADYCNLDRAIESQKGEDIVCNNNYECISNLCADNKCISPNFWRKILSWFSSIFE